MRAQATDRTPSRREPLAEGPKNQRGSSLLMAALPSLPPTLERERDSGAAGSGAGSAGPLDAAEALMSVQQEATSDQMQDELLLMAREVARVSGELPAQSIVGDAAGT